MKPSAAQKVIKDKKKTDIERFKAFAELVKSVSEDKEANAKYEPIKAACDKLKLSDLQKDMILKGMIESLFSEVDTNELMDLFASQYNGKREELPEAFQKNPLDTSEIVNYFLANKNEIDNTVRNLTTAAMLISRDKYDLDALNFGAMNLYGENINYNLQLFTDALSGAAKTQSQMKPKESKSSNPLDDLISKEEGFIKEQKRFLKAAAGTSNFTYLVKAMKKSLNAHEALLEAMKEVPFPSKNFSDCLEQLANADKEIFVNLERFKKQQAETPDDPEITKIAKSLQKTGSKMASIQDVLMNVTNQPGQYKGPFEEIKKEISKGRKTDATEAQMDDVLALLDNVQRELNNSVQKHEAEKRKKVVAKSTKIIDKIESQKKSALRRAFTSKKAKAKSEIGLQEANLDRAMASTYLDLEDLATIEMVEQRETDSLKKVESPQVGEFDVYVDPKNAAPTIIGSPLTKEEAASEKNINEPAVVRSTAFDDTKQSLTEGAKKQLTNNIFELDKFLQLKVDRILESNKLNDNDDIDKIQTKQKELEKLMLLREDCASLINGASYKLDQSCPELQTALLHITQNVDTVQTELNKLKLKEHELKAKGHKKAINKHKDDYEFYTDFIPDQIKKAGLQADKIASLETKSEMTEEMKRQMRVIFRDNTLALLKQNLEQLIATHREIIQNIESTIQDIPNNKQRQKAFGAAQDDLKSKISNIETMIKRLKEGSTNLFISDPNNPDYNKNLDYLEKYKHEKIKLLEQQLNLRQMHAQHLVSKLPKNVSKSQRDTLLEMINKTFEVDSSLSSDEKIKRMEEQVNNYSAVIDAINPEIIHKKSAAYVADRIKNKLAKIAPKTKYAKNREAKGSTLTGKLGMEIHGKMETQKKSPPAPQDSQGLTFTPPPGREAPHSAVRETLDEELGTTNIAISYEDAVENLRAHIESNPALEELTTTGSDITCSYRGTIFTLKQGESGETILEMPKSAGDFNARALTDFLTEAPLVTAQNAPRGKVISHQKSMQVESTKTTYPLEGTGLILKTSGDHLSDSNDFPALKEALNDIEAIKQVNKNEDANSLNIIIELDDGTQIVIKQDLDDQGDKLQIEAPASKQEVVDLIKGKLNDVKQAKEALETSQQQTRKPGTPREGGRG